MCPKSNENQVRDLHQSISMTAAKALRQLADQLESVQDPGQLAQIAGETHGVAFRVLTVAGDWMNAERKAA